MKQYLAVATALVMGSSAVFATTISPSYDTFGSLPSATFGGTGIPNGSVAQTVLTIGGDTVTFGLTATARYSNPTVGNNSLGTFSATPGSNNGLDGASPAHSIGPTWNFDYYINIASPSSKYRVGLLYSDNTTGASGLVDFGALSAGTYQDSWNLMFGFLNTISYDPNANDTYGFALTLLNADGRAIGNDAAINVNVNGGDRRVPDSGSTILLLGCSFAGLALLGRRQMRLATVAK